ncbi:hypothetical protein L484_003330 [Morus notabilis]|uniref:Uncharacterized protein n=1 Tax=Morus notabilis TaxID=981085 RepID=W9R9R0_9ROSA|nr:hypothetical protein L484_003330 [Morus notabilis]
MHVTTHVTRASSVFLWERRKEGLVLENRLFSGGEKEIGVGVAVCVDGGEGGGLALMAAPWNSREDR